MCRGVKYSEEQSMILQSMPNEQIVLGSKLFVSHSHNKLISFENIGFWPKIYLILYPSLENSTTQITITLHQG
jgi:hypothetical protein